MKVSYFVKNEKSKVSKEETIESIFENIRSKGEWEDLVHEVRTGKREKVTVPSYTPSGTFKGLRRKEYFKEHSGVIGIDIDEKDNPDLQDKKAFLAGDPYCFGMHHSIGGFGIVWYAKINPEKHLESFLAIEKYLSNKYEINVDPSGKDVTRLRFISYDPALYHNPKSKKWAKYLTKEQKQSFQQPIKVAYHDDDIGYIIRQIQDKSINIAEDYHDWRNIGFALASEFGEGGRDYFHAVSRQSSKYDAKDVNRQYDISIRRGNLGIGIGTFFYLCKRANVETRSDSTKAIEIAYRQRVKTEPRQSKEQRRESLVRQFEMQGVDREFTEQVVERAEAIPQKELEQQKSDDKALELEQFIQGLGIRFNVVTNKLEVEGQDMNDRLMNTIYRKSMHAIDYNISKKKVENVIFSDIIPEFNPFLEWIENNKHLKPEGRIKDVLDCFEIENPEIDGEIYEDYLEVFLERWLVGIISSMHGTYSLMTLVLCGGQGVGKTKFFRNLLPEELFKYYAEGKLENNNEVGTLMCSKLLFCDDEFGGKTKREASAFKDISSKSIFTIRLPYDRFYTDMQRYAVLCATSNEYNVISDVTGNRRIIPVNIKNIDHERFEAINKDELFMELYWKWKSIGDGWMLGKKEIKYLNNASEAHNLSENFEVEMLLKYFKRLESAGGNCTPKTTSEMKVYLEERTKEKINLHKLGTALHAQGYCKKSIKRNGVSRYRWLVEENFSDRSEGHDNIAQDGQNDSDVTNVTEGVDF